MIQNVYCIHDRAAGAYLTPFVLANDKMAIRVFTQCATSQDHQFGKNPEDFTLFHCGTFDDQTATLESWAPQKVINALEAVDAFQRQFEKMNGQNKIMEISDDAIAQDKNHSDPANQ